MMMKRIVCAIGLMPIAGSTGRYGSAPSSI